jgi:GNAT superfamily N-acetyltransferase
MRSAQTIVVYACPRCRLAYQAIQERISESQAGHFNCIDCGSEVHSWFGIYDYVGWKLIEMTQRISGLGAAVEECARDGPEMDTPLTPLIIRPASRSDLPRLLAIYPHLDPADRIPPLDVAERRFEELQKYHGSAIFIGATEGAVVTSCTLIVIPNLTRGGQPYGLIENVVTHAAFRGRGFGKQVLQAAVAAAWQADCYKVMLMTGSKKPSTLAFYTSVGFEQNKTGFQIRRLPPREEVAD